MKLGLNASSGCATLSAGQAGKRASVTIAIQVWNPDEWETFSYSLLRSRHGPLNVHKIPAAHKGDLGIDFYCTADSVAYQCYSVQEPIDITTRADRQKAKITRDLAKLDKNNGIVSQLFLNAPIRNWILLVPRHDSKEVNLHCSQKTVELRAAGHQYLANDFELGVHDLDAFSPQEVSKEIGAMSSVALSVAMPTAEEIANWSSGSPDLLNNARVKLSKRAGQAKELSSLVEQSINWFLEGSALLDALRDGSPDLHDQVVAAIASRATRLQLGGPAGGPDPGKILLSELDSLKDAVRQAAPNLTVIAAEKIALGTLSEWIMRCPLDFPAHAT
jgi:hypothetical protein